MDPRFLRVFDGIIGPNPAAILQCRLYGNHRGNSETLSGDLPVDRITQTLIRLFAQKEFGYSSYVKTAYLP